MAKQMKSKVKAKKGGKKSFFEVAAPVTATKIYLYAPSAESLVGKMVKLDLTKSLRGKSLELKLRINQSGDKLQADPESVTLVASFIRKTMRKGTDYAEDSFEVECKDCVARVKPLLISRKRVSRAVLGVLRENARRHLVAYMKTRTAKEIFSEIIANKVQKQLAVKLKKVYPLSLCEIRVFTIQRMLS